MSTPTYPDVTDPILITTNDRTFFVCWVEFSSGELRWVFMSARPPVRYAGPEYHGETSTLAIEALVNRWWDTRKLRGLTGT